MNILRSISPHKYLVAIIGGLLILALITGGVIFKNSQNETGSVSNDQVEINSDDNALATESAKEKSEKESEKESTSVDSTSETSTDNQSSGSNTNSSQSQTQEEELEVIPPPPPPPPPPPKTVTISGSGFSPSLITINVGDTVKWVNNDSKAHEPASNDHPSHEIYSAFDSDPGIGAGSSWSFKFNNTGTWYYHDHRSSSKTGVVVVQ